MYRNDQNPSTNRCRITGKLTARTPLHVGDGDSLPLRDRQQVREDDPDAEYSSFVTGAGDTILIPGSTLKGVLRAWLVRRALVDRKEELIEAVFGSPAGGGKAEFHDAPLVERTPRTNEYRWWDSRRGTCLAPGVALNPSTRTAEEGLLYHTEFAPEGSTFAVTITAQNLRLEERDFLLSALATAFADADDPACLGAETADGWGQMAWSEPSCAVIEPDDVRTWLEAGAVELYERIFRPIAVSPSPLPVTPAGPCLLLDVRLRFAGAFLINDPSQATKSAEGREDGAVGHATVQRLNGQYFLPGSSVRGALRAQARRIWQTLAHDTPADLRRAGTTEARGWEEVYRLAPFDRMLGAAGWQAPMSVPDFELSGRESRLRQEFVAIDRFTGGAAHQRKFRADCLYAPEFRGTIGIDLHRWGRARVGGWAMLLLLFLLRDLQEGDVRFGFGSAKGYGACIAGIAPRCTGSIPAEYGGDHLESLIRGILTHDRDALGHALLDQWARDLQTTIEPSAA